MTDSTSLKIDVDSTAVATAEQALNRFASAGGGAEAAVGRFEASLKKLETEAGRAAAAQRLLDDTRRASQDRERTNIANSERFIENLKRESEAVGRTRSELLRLQADRLGLGERASPLIQIIEDSEKAKNGLLSIGKGQQLLAYQTQLAAIQVKDFFAQVAAGGNPLQALLIQGTQVTTMFGGLGNAARAFARLITPITVGLGATVVALGAAGFAAVKGFTEFNRFNDALALAGNTSAVTAGRFEASARAIATTSRGTIGQAKEAALGALSAGVVSQRAFESIAAASVSFSRVSSRSVKDVQEQFSGMARNVTAGAEQLTKTYGFLSAEELRRVRQLDASGRAEEALALTMKAVTDSVNARAPALTGLNKLLKEGAQLWSDFWNAAARIGAPETVEEKLRKAEKALEDFRNRQSARRPDTGLQLQVAPSFRDKVGLNPGKEAGLMADLAQAQEAVKEEGRFARQAAQQARVEQAEALKETTEFLSNRAAAKNAAAQLESSRQALALEKERIALERGYDEFLLTTRAYFEKRAAIERQELARQDTLIARQIAAEKSKPVDKPEEKVAQEARITELAARRLDILRQRSELEEKIRRGELLPEGGLREPQFDSERDAAALFRQAEGRAQGDTDKAFAERGLAAEKSAQELAQTNKDLNARLLKDDRARGEAQIAIDVEVQRRKLDLGALSPEARRAAESELANFRLLREKQLTEELKPEWQKQLEAYRDVHKTMQASFDSFASNMLKTAEDMWVEFAVTGKVNVRGLVAFMTAEFARINFRKMIGGANGIEGFFSALKTLVSGASLASGSSGTGDFARFDRGQTDVVPGRAWGGSVRAGRMYEVDERQGPGELLTAGGRQYLMAKQDGLVTPAYSGGGGSATYYISIDARADMAQSAQMIQEAIVKADRIRMAALHSSGAY